MPGSTDCVVLPGRVVKATRPSAKRHRRRRLVGVDDVAGAVERDQFDELGVHDGAVQALGVVLDDDLPVGGDDRLGAGADPVLGDRAGAPKLEQTRA